MSVIVKGMKMPENCMECKIKQYVDYESDYCVCPFSEVMCLSIGRQDACPLVALPDHHGRLVDAGECAEYFWDHLDDNGMAGAINAINDMPTIVEAEDEP